MSQYQAYEKTAYGSSPSPQNHSSEPYSAQILQSSTAAPTQQPSQTTLPAPSHHNLQQPNMVYQTQQTMSEKPHSHDHAQPVDKQHASKFGRRWLFGLSDCCSPLDMCCLSWWCPCVLFGRTYARERGEGESSGCNLMCLAHYCAMSFGVSSCLQCIVRGQRREKYGIDSTAINDFCASLCCPCCTLVQEEKESIVRLTGMDPKTKVAYQPINQNMSYPA